MQTDSLKTSLPFCTSSPVSSHVYAVRAFPTISLSTPAALSKPPSGSLAENDGGQWASADNCSSLRSLQMRKTQGISPIIIRATQQTPESLYRSTTPMCGRFTKTNWSTDGQGTSTHRFYFIPPVRWHLCGGFVIQQANTFGTLMQVVHG